jgi:hypothetical protein
MIALWPMPCPADQRHKQQTATSRNSGHNFAPTVYGLLGLDADQTMALKQAEVSKNFPIRLLRFDCNVD